MSRRIDFLAKIQGQSDYQILPSRDRTEIDLLVDEYNRSGMNEHLARRLHAELVRLGENRAFLDAAQKNELRAVLRTERSPAVRRRNINLILFVLSAAAFVAIIFFTVHSMSERNPSPPPAGTIQQNQQKQIPVQNTALQQFQADWGPFTQITGQPPARYLLLLDAGATYQSQWVLPPDSQWAPDITGDVPSVDIHGSYADITDTTGTPYTVGVGQPFVIAGNPQIILRVDPAGNIYYMSIAHGTVIRVK